MKPRTALLILLIFVLIVIVMICLPTSVYDWIYGVASIEQDAVKHHLKTKHGWDPEPFFVGGVDTSFKEYNWFDPDSYIAVPTERTYINAAGNWIIPVDTCLDNWEIIDDITNKIESYGGELSTGSSYEPLTTIWMNDNLQYYMRADSVVLEWNDDSTSCWLRTVTEDTIYYGKTWFIFADTINVELGIRSDGSVRWREIE